jgi:hypothetical protein|tara:strand:- start:804 stop:1025 length:222 start_codon:yes stop_codon:yes gene_type:complete
MISKETLKKLQESIFGGKSTLDFMREVRSVYDGRLITNSFDPMLRVKSNLDKALKLRRYLDTLPGRKRFFHEA